MMMVADVWQQFAREVEGTIVFDQVVAHGVRAQSWDRIRLTIPIYGSLLFLRQLQNQHPFETPLAGQGLLVRLPYWKSDSFEFRARPAQGLTSIEAIVEPKTRAPAVPTQYADLDQNIIFETYEPLKLNALLNENRLRILMLKQANDLSWRFWNSWQSSGSWAKGLEGREEFVYRFSAIPEETYYLCSSQNALIEDIQQLRDCYELFVCWQKQFFAQGISEKRSIEQ